MEFKPEQLDTLEGSMQFLTDSMLNTCKYVVSNRILENKPFWMVQTEKFASFFNRVKNKLESMEKVRHKIVTPVYDNYNANLTSQLINSDGVVQDDYIKVNLQQSNDFKINVKPGGVYFQLEKVFLPISEVYTQAVNYSLMNKNENVPFPVHILLGFYSTIYQAVKDKESEESMEMLKSNIQTLLDALEICDLPQNKKATGPVDMLQNMLGKIDMGQIGEMMSKVTGDPKASKDFGEVFGKMSEVIKQGGNPLEAMGDIIKNASIRAQEEDVTNEKEDIPITSEEAHKQE